MTDEEQDQAIKAYIEKSMADAYQEFIAVVNDSLNPEWDGTFK